MGELHIVSEDNRTWNTRNSVIHRSDEFVAVVDRDFRQFQSIALSRFFQFRGMRSDGLTRMSVIFTVTLCLFDAFIRKNRKRTAQNGLAEKQPCHPSDSLTGASFFHQMFLLLLFSNMSILKTRPQNKAYPA